MFSIKRPPNIGKVILKFEELPRATTKGIRAAFYICGKKLVEDTKEEINRQPKHGRAYRVYQGAKGRLKSPRTVIASAPGEAPAVRTGELRKAINFTVNGAKDMHFGVDLTRGDAPYGKFLEYENLLGFTGQGSSRMKPRPYISASYKKNKTQLGVIFKRELDKYYK